MSKIQDELTDKESKCPVILPCHKPSQLVDRNDATDIVYWVSARNLIFLSCDIFADKNGRKIWDLSEKTERWINILSPSTEKCQAGERPLLLSFLRCGEKVCILGAHKHTFQNHTRATLWGGWGVWWWKNKKGYGQSYFAKPFQVNT